VQKTQQSFGLNNLVCLELPSEIDKKNCPTFKASKKALLLINAAPEDSLKVIADLKKIEGISEVYSLKGMYDIIAYVEAESFEKLKDTTLERIRRISNIKSKLTLTLIKDHA